MITELRSGDRSVAAATSHNEHLARNFAEEQIRARKWRPKACGQVIK